MGKALAVSLSLLLGACAAEPAAINQPRAAAISGAADAYANAQERDFRERLRGTGVGVARPGDQIVLSLVDHILFEGDSSRISAEGEAALALIAGVARRYDRTALIVSAFTDGLTGTPRDGVDPRQLARAVAAALIADGVQRGRVFAQGYSAARRSLGSGKRVSVARNRRVEIRIRPRRVL